MKNKHHVLSALVAVALLAALAGCQSGYNKPGFATEVDEDGRLWVFKQGGDKEKSEKHITLVGAGPDRMTVKAVDKGTALEYLATKPGFVAEAVEEDAFGFSRKAATWKRARSTSHVSAPARCARRLKPSTAKHLTPTWQADASTGNSSNTSRSVRFDPDASFLSSRRGFNCSDAHGIPDRGHAIARRVRQVGHAIGRLPGHRFTCQRRRGAAVKSGPAKDK